VKQIAALIEKQANTQSTSGSYYGTLPAACDGDSTEKFSAVGCTIYGVDVTTFRDPIANGAGSACLNAASASCDFSSTVNNAATYNYEICFYLEAGISGFSAGSKKITKGGTISNGCSR
jgi:hypothetical protein